MGIRVKARGTITTSAATPFTVNAPAGWVSGNRSILIVDLKSEIFNLTGGTSGWTPVGTKMTGGTGSSGGVDVGPMAGYVFYRDDAPNNPTLTFDVVNSASGVIHILENDSAWDGPPTVTSGADTSSGLAFSASGAIDLDLLRGDCLLVAESLPSDGGTTTKERVTVPGCTMAGRRLLNDNGTLAGNDHRNRNMLVDVLDGDSTGVPTLTFDNTTNISGLAMFVRLRETVPETFDFERAILALNPLLYWRLDEGWIPGAPHSDSSPHNRESAAATNVTREQAGLLGPQSAVTPNSTATAGASYADEAALDVADVSFVYVARTTPTGAFQRFGGKSGASSAQQSCELRMNASNVLQVQFRTDTEVSMIAHDYTGPIDFDDGQWHLFIVTWTAASDTLSLMIDGPIAQSWSAVGTSMFVSTGAVFYGSRESGGDMVDGMDEFAYFGTGITEAQSIALYEALSPPAPSGIPLYLWNGSDEIPMNLFLWDGANEVPYDLTEVAP